MWRNAVNEEHTSKEADVIERFLQLKPHANILDVPCGNGRIALELASRGYQLTGIDISSGFLDEARSNSIKLQLNIIWEQREMRDLPWHNEFDGVCCFGNSFGFLDDKGNADFLKAVNRTLKPKGRFVLDACSVAENVLPQMQPHTEMQIGDIQFIEDNHYDHMFGRLDTDYTFIKDGNVEKKFGSHRLYTYREICRLLEDAGFSNYEGYDSSGQSPYTFGSQGLIFVATKE